VKSIATALASLFIGTGSLFAQLDGNANGMSDLWERHFNQGQLFEPGFTATGDQDGDGQNNLAEAISGTDPLKFDPPEGQLVQTIRHVLPTWGQEPGQNEPVLLTPEAFEIQWQAVAGKQYTLTFSPDLEAGSWLPVGDPIYADVGGPILIGCLPDAGIGQMPDKFFWRVQAGDIDQDGDGLNDYEEHLLGTYYWAQETYPGFPDLWLATHYPSAQGFDPDADDDSDGLTNFEEYLNGSDPHHADSDGDGTTDAAEVNQGSNPHDNSDGGAPPVDPLEEVDFTVGGDYAYWRMEIQGQGPRDTRLLRVASQFPGDTVTRALKLQRNNKYEITLHRVGGYPDWYCWEAGVGGQPSEPTFDAGQGWYLLGPRNQNARFFGVADHWLVDNRDGLLTQHLDSYEYDVASGLKAVLLPVGLTVDANRDGKIDFGQDETSATTPYRFWINNDDDSEEDEEEYGENSEPDHLDNNIPTQRDLEDFTRIQMLVGGLHEQLKSGEIQVAIKFRSETVEGSPGLNLWLHLDHDGGRGYLVEEESAANHLALGQPGRVSGNATYTFAPSFWSGMPGGNYPAIADAKPFRYMLFEGASKGKGELVLELKQGNEVLVEICSCWIELLDVRNMYQRAKITPDNPDAFTEPSDFGGEAGRPTIQPPIPEIGWVWDPDGKDFIEDPMEEKQYLVFVHGWRMTYVGSQKYAESMFKRLWQSGYKGRYAFVRWPTYSEDTHSTTNGILTYNISDYRAWLCGKGVAAFVNNLPPAYVRNITAHSMGNVVVGSALREGMQVDNYALLNAAVPAMCYDPNEALYEFARITPDGDADPITNALGFKGKISDENVRRSMVNFYLANDSALTGIVDPPLVGEFGGWEHNNANYKPESFNLGTTGYEYDPDRDPGTKVYITFVLDLGRHIRSFHEAAAYATASRTKTVGADGRTAGAIKDKVDMDSQYGFGSTHSAEWLWRFQKTDRFYHDLMDKLDLDPIP
jgi:hypothetical protein